MEDLLDFVRGDAILKMRGERVKLVGYYAMGFRGEGRACLYVDHRGLPVCERGMLGAPVTALLFRGAPSITVKNGQLGGEAGGLAGMTQLGQWGLQIGGGAVSRGGRRVSPRG